MSFPCYPEHKESGFERLGLVPIDWDLHSLKRSVEGCVNGIWGEEADGENDLAVIRVADFQRSKLRIGTKKLTYRSITDKEKEARKLRVGDLLIEKSGGGDKTLVGCVVLFEHDFGAVSSNFVARMRPLPNFDSNFLCYAFDSLYKGRVNYPSIKQTTGIQNLDSESYLQERFCFPSLTEQTQIAHFLDHETAKIDTLIHEQKRLIELLKEKRQAVISHAVTKGLNPDVPMKDSGVEWLGDVPAHWQISKLSHYANLLTGFPFPSSSFSQDDSDVRLLRGANVGVSILKWEDTVYWDLNKDDSLSKYEMSEDQIVIGMDRPWIGGGLRIARVTKKDMPCLLLQRVAAITATEFLDDNYLFNILQSAAFKTYVEPDLTGVSIPHLSPEQILGFTVPIPPTQEQILIFNHINEQIERNGDLLDQAKVSTRLLEERRAALISAAVTGKIDVRSWQPPVDVSAFDEEMHQAGMKVTA